MNSIPHHAGRDRAGMSLASCQAALQAWYTGPVGQRVWQSEQRLLEHHLPELFGYHLLSLGVNPALDLAAASPIHHCVRLSPVQRTDVAACADFHALPLETESMDVALLHHSLDYSEDPHQLLRETARVLIPYGHVLVFGFQRWSALGLQHTVQRRLQPQDLVANHDFMGLLRLHDWLKLLDFEIIKSRHTVFVPPQAGESVRKYLGWFERLSWGAQLPFGSVYFVLARKTVAGVRPIPATWRNMRALGNPLVGALSPQPVAPSVRKSRHRLH